MKAELSVGWAYVINASNAMNASAHVSDASMPSCGALKCTAASSINACSSLGGYGFMANTKYVSVCGARVAYLWRTSEIMRELISRLVISVDAKMRTCKRFTRQN